MTPVKDVGAFTAKVSSVTAINNQLSFRHVVRSKYLPTRLLKRSVLNSSNCLIENNLYPSKNNKTADLNLKKLVSPILFFLCVYDIDFFVHIDAV